MHSLLSAFSKHIAITPEILKAFEKEIVFTTYSKGDIISPINTICNRVYFLNSGFVETYCIDIKGKQSVNAFFWIKAVF
jgi:signal-transduction protein with cAMP-binding, CBS, and nucleotidyltransferase domain